MTPYYQEEWEDAIVWCYAQIGELLGWLFIHRVITFDRWIRALDRTAVIADKAIKLWS